MQGHAHSSLALLAACGYHVPKRTPTMDLMSRLQEGVLLLDGAMGTELFRLGLSGAGELWNLEQASDVESVHRAYVEAGSEAVITNTFGANRIKLKMTGLADRTVELNKAGARLALDAADGRFVFGDIGPTGSLPPSLGGESKNKMTDTFKEQAETLAETGVDAFIIETMVSAEECEIAVRACERIGGLPIMALMSFEEPVNDNFRTVMGDGIDDFNRMTDSGASVVGSNCGTLDAGEMADLVSRIISAVDVPVIAQPNAGKPVLSGDNVTYPYAPAEMLPGMEALIRSGVSIVGGCCGTTPDHIQMMSESIIKAN